jgi:hypothetical protein
VTMNRCSKCEGFIPEAQTRCPNCRSASAWWVTPLAFAGAGLASVTLSACYGVPCVATVKLPDGGVQKSCGIDYDCTVPLADGGVRTQDPTWVSECTDTRLPVDAGSDGGADGGSDAGP